jgi:hypothetical protein
VPPRAVSLTAPGRLRKPARPVLRLDREELAARGSNGQTRSDSMKRGTEAEPDHIRHVPRWSAGRRAVRKQLSVQTAHTCL